MKSVIRFTGLLVTLLALSASAGVCVAQGDFNQWISLVVHSENSARPELEVRVHSFGIERDASGTPQLKNTGVRAYIYYGDEVTAVLRSVSPTHTLKQAIDEHPDLARKIVNHEGYQEVRQVSDRELNPPRCDTFP